MYRTIPHIRTYKVTDDNNNVIRTVDHRYWTHGICQLNIRNFSDSDKTAVSVHIDSDFNISIPVMESLNEPRRFNIQPLTLSLSSQNFDNADAAERYAHDIEQAAQALREFTDIMHTLDGLDNSNNITESILGFGDLKKGLTRFVERPELTDKQKEAIIEKFNSENDYDLESLKDHYHQAQHVQTVRPDETLDLIDKAYNRTIACVIEHLENN